jgi:TonB family protein
MRTKCKDAEETARHTLLRNEECGTLSIVAYAPNESGCEVFMRGRNLRSGWVRNSGSHAHLMPIVLVLLAAFAAVPAARAQDPSMDAAATEIADAITHAKQKGVIVFDFSGPNARLTALGAKLADDFSSLLAKAAPGIHVENRTHIAEIVSADQYSPEVIYRPAYDSVLASALRVKVYVTGTIVLQGQNLTVLVKSRPVKSWQEIASLQFSVPLTGEVKELLDRTLADAPAPPYIDPDDKGYTSPKCLFCPRADYTEEAMRYKAQGVVILEAVVGADGRFESIRVIKPMPYGLTEKAIATVSKWKLAPAKGPDGNPIAVRQTIMVFFGLG